MLQVSTSDAQTFKTLRQSFLAEVVANLEARFPQVSIISAMSILNPQNLPRDLLTYGNTQLDELVDHFDASLGVNECKEEWSCLKQLAALNYSSLELQQFWLVICKHHKEQFPFKLAHACMAVPVSTATCICERGFSTQNRTHSGIV